MATSFGDRMLRYVRRATQDVRSTAQLFEEVLPALQESVQGKPEIIKMLDDVVQRLRQDQVTIDAIYGKMQEHNAVAQTTQYDLAHLETFLSCLEEYYRGDLDTVRKILDLIDSPILRKALIMMDADVFERWTAAVEDAKQARSAGFD